ncbi:MAG: GNAT family N-acetyltransferase [Bacteroidia bacterium]
MSQILIRQANPTDLKQILALFTQTVKEVNSRDYDTEQIEVWLLQATNESRWLDAIKNQYFLLAFEAEQMLGFGSLSKKGLIDFLFVHAHEQKKGIARILYKALEKQAYVMVLSSLYVSASISARPFFQKMGFELQKVEPISLGNVRFENWYMEKPLDLEAKT